MRLGEWVSGGSGLPEWRRAENVACLPDSPTISPLTHSPTLTHTRAHFLRSKFVHTFFENIFYKNSQLPTCDFVDESG